MPGGEAKSGIEPAAGERAAPARAGSRALWILCYSVMLPVLVGIVALALGFAWFLYRVPTDETPPDHTAEGIVVLTGGALRINDAVELLAAGRGRRLLITGVNPTTHSRELAALTPRYKALFGCCIDLDHSALNTIGNAVETRRWTRARGFHSLIVVTSAYHMPRAIGVFRHMGFAVEAYPVDWRTRGPVDLVMPMESVTAGLRRTDTAVHEWAGLFAYWVTGRSTALFPAP